MDEIEEELEHQLFMNELYKLVETIMWKIVCRSLTQQNDVNAIKSMWDDIDVYGDEPIFASMLFDKMEEEAK